MAVGLFVLGEICERHPRLRVAFLEGTGGWIVPMLERFDHQFRVFGSRDQKSLPSELFARQCVISFDPDEVALAFTAEHLGADKILWASDYPQPGRQDPGRAQGAGAGRGVPAARITGRGPRAVRPAVLQPVIDQPACRRP